MPTFSRHSNFFSSLEQVEKRLRLENPSESALHSPLPLPQNTSEESLSPPIYFNLDLPNNSSSLQDSEPPREFLSNSFEFPPTQGIPSQLNGGYTPQKISEAEDSVVDDIERLIQLLGLSDSGENASAKRESKVGLGSRFNDGQCCDDGFYANIVGVKGPKCMKEVERLEGWIKYFSTGGGGGEESREPLRLVHLLVGKAIFVQGESGGFEGFEFPSTIEEYLRNDPPTD